MTEPEDPQRHVGPDEAMAAIEAVINWIEAAYGVGNVLDGFGFNAQADWITTTAGNLEDLIDTAFATVGGDDE